MKSPSQKNSFLKPGDHRDMLDDIEAYSNASGADGRMGKPRSGTPSLGGGDLLDQMRNLSRSSRGQMDSKAQALLSGRFSSNLGESERAHLHSVDAREAEQREKSRREMEVLRSQADEFEGATGFAKYTQIDQINAAMRRASVRSEGVLDGSGICLSLCCTWIQLHRAVNKKGGNAAARVGLMEQRIQNLAAFPFMEQGTAFPEASKQKTNQNFLNTAKMQDAYIKNLNRTVPGGVEGRLQGRIDTVRYLLELYGMDSPKVATDMERNLKIEDVIDSIERHCYTLILIYFYGGGAHAVCCYKSAGKFYRYGDASSHIYFYDPNFGEYRIRNSRIKDFIDFFKKLYTKVGMIFQIVKAVTFAAGDFKSINSTHFKSVGGLVITPLQKAGKNKK